MVGVLSFGSGRAEDERFSGGLVIEVCVEGDGVERGRGRAEKAMVMVAVNELLC